MRITTLTLSLLLAAPRSTASPPPPIDAVPAQKVAPNTWVIHGPMGHPSAENRAFINNPAFLQTADGVVVVDPGSSVQIGAMVLQQIRLQTDRPVIAVLNTHVHGDHWLGNDAIRRAYPDVPIYAHPRMIAEVTQGAGERWVEMLNGITENAIEGTQVAAPTHPVDNGDELTLGGMQFRFHHNGQAHTATDLMIEVPGEDLLFTGDNANNGRIVRMDDGNFEGNIEALDIALALQRKIVVPGHGQSGGSEVIAGYRDYLTGLYQSVAELFEQGLSDFEMKDQVEQRLQLFSDWTGYQEELGKHISLAYLQIEAAAF